MGAEQLLKGNFGLFNHYLYGNSNWVETTNNLDIPRLAKNIAETGASYYFITLMQQTKYMLAPNKSYDEIAGTKPGEACAIRDVPMELGHELKKYGVDLYLYYTGDGPYRDDVIGRKFGFIEPRKNISMDFVDKWTAVLREYSIRYGDLVKGWWIDGCYRNDFNYTDEMLDKYHEACKAGNPDCIVCTNQGVNFSDDISASGKYEEFTCGEELDFTKVPKSQFYGNAQAHLLIPIGVAPNGNNSDSWCKPGIKRDAAFIADYIRKLKEVPCALTIDICIGPDGSYDPVQVETLKKVTEMLSK